MNKHFLFSSADAFIFIQCSFTMRARKKNTSEEKKKIRPRQQILI